MSTLTFFIESVHIFKSEFEKIYKESKTDNKNKIDNEEKNDMNDIEGKIIDYIFQLINPKNKNITIDEEIYKAIQGLLKEKNSKVIGNNKDSKYFFQESKELSSFLINAYSSYLIHMHMRFEGPTGIGKTVAACALGRIITNNQKKYYIQSFHSGTKPNQCYGGWTIINNKPDTKDGLLTLAMNEGTVFITDEFNLSSKETMKSILPSLSHFNDYKIYFPGIEKKLKINNNFIFIACQNKVGTLGRNKLPDLIEYSLREFSYPSHIKKSAEEIKEIENDVKTICDEINKSLKKENKNEIFRPITGEEARNLGKFMLKFNQLNKNYLQPLSFRDIKKIFNRIYYQRNKKKKNIFIGFEVYHNIIFYILSKLNKQNIIDIKKDLMGLIKEIFSLKLEYELDIYFENSLKLEKKNVGGIECIFLIKGLCKVDISENLKDEMKKRILSYINLQNFLNPFFYAIISSKDESLLFLGKTSCKTFLCETIFIKGFEHIHLNQETKIDQLLGGPMILSKKEAKNFYFKYLCYLCGRGKVKELYEDFEANKLDKSKFNSESQTAEGFDFAIENFKELLFNDKNKINQEKEEEKEKQDFFSDYVIVFKPGFILDSLIRDKPFILKDISNLHSDVLERFNQFLTEEKKITLIEDIYNTFTNNDNKEIIFNASNRVLATANDGYENKLSEAILSRFTVINVESYELEEEKIIINMEFNDSINNSQKEVQELNRIITLFRKIESILQITISLSQKIGIIKIIQKLKKTKEVDENLDISEIVLFNMFKGLFEFRTQKSKKYNSFINLFNNKKLWNYEENKPTLGLEEIRERKSKRRGIKSYNTKLYIDNPNSKKISAEDIAFTEKFCENIDIIHFSIKLKIPLILEGILGSGKKTALDYIFKLFNIRDNNIINIYITENTKKEDLLGKITATAEKNIIKVESIQTDLIKALINEDKDNYAIIFHNINKASPGLIELLENIFDNNKENILLPNGDNIQKNKENRPYLFGIFDSENGKINRNSLPKFLLRSCIYFIVQNPNGKDISKIISSKFRNKPYKIEANFFEDNFLLATEIQNNYTPSTIQILYL